MGAKPGRMKGNKQEAEYGNREGWHGKSGQKERGKPESESGSGRKEAEAERKMQEAKAESKHLRNSCGSESGKGERKRTGSRVRESGKEA